MKLLKPNFDRDSYRVPIIKIVLCCIVIGLCCTRNSFLKIDNLLLSFLLTVVSLFLLIISILSISTATTEIIALKERRDYNRLDPKEAYEKGVDYSLNEILALLKSNEVVEILIVFEKKIVKVGSSAESKPGVSELFNKVYYFKDISCTVSPEEIEKRIEPYGQNGKYRVFSIDGVPPR
ncbi:MAG: hypothetical protein IKC69_03030 [Clostridia bacterium]|nr:hypothetical protein [Clostridia bacterium]